MDIEKMFQEMAEHIGQMSADIGYWKLEDQIVAEFKRLQAIEYYYNLHQKDQLFVWEGEVFKGFGNKSSAWATYVVWNNVDIENIRDMVMEQPRDDFISLGETLKDAVIYSVIYPEGDDSLADLSELHEYIIDGVIETVNWTELAEKWSAVIYDVDG